MRSAVRSAFVGFTTTFEGAIPYFYLDIKALVTIGIGNLVDPCEAAIGLPMRHADGSLASRLAIVADWSSVKNHVELARQGYRAAKQYTRLHLDDTGIAQVVGDKLDDNDRALAARYSCWESLPADAQLAIHSLTWACGPAYHFPALDVAVRSLDFMAAAIAIHIDDSHNPGVTPRNVADVRLCHNAARVLSLGLDPDVLYYPRDLISEPDPKADTLPPDAPTLPELGALAADGIADAAVDEEQRG